ncbi:transcriptional regulator with PAS, ATPase and Fis domain [Clostridium saccharoperbutylacetonicum]|uniref:Sigma54 specific transcriptional regulator, Fis family n=1 Tax=Clostridium saccharoperbutylacetonicum N1-4(HMT) TaxID=931276 RepID=M1MJS9_9CLOT|nr:sigma-54-dependent Fis family transcriptional regulator [Clostridium saccharoperbutylacetonicum]AGF58169.1 sigma54 specific transcriptional regulator, Fis family [Clostridium saccharoperbutylacetonicum N1-4(HMT)]NRT61057.1 transcriptional regulator with PAS, ATPase and Fis domain [Clostridium saccharoperbutylacetonicum]NSB24372.1 transcriptional regulator with PAS, ATPase and Fis domain [Clostridium saccharoperbutylacetonicum]NSB43748.1 transcriptional regulator with PAS, ATPase and Fis doma
MAKILFIVPTQKIKAIIYNYIEEYSNYYTSMFNEKQHSEIEIIVSPSLEKIDLLIYNADIFVARGATAIQIKKLYPNTPVVEIPVTTMDVVSSVISLQKENTNNSPIALVGFGNISYQSHFASQLCNTPVIPFHFSYHDISTNHISKLLDKIDSDGFKYIIGGIRIINIAQQKNIISTCLHWEREAIWIAIREAQHTSGIRHQERKRAVYFENILNHSHEGIISTDANNKIIHINSSAGKILDINPPLCTGENLETIIPDSKFKSILNNTEDYSDELIKTKNINIILNKVNTSLGNETLGNVITFQNVNNIYNTELKIRKKLYNKGLIAKYNFTNIIGHSAALQDAIKKAKTFAKTPSNILITGASGTGKELFSQSIHNYSTRKSGSFVAVNCAAIPENLMESEFFGYSGGAFTGASKDGKMGYFELAHEGTIFLDEISEIPLNLQGKLLRVIQENEIMRIGDDKVVPINIRIICATNKDLKMLVNQGKFREDLYYRLCVLQLRLPPLRERGEDILKIANHYIDQYAYTIAQKPPLLSSEAGELFLKYSWDGNIRELRNICEQLVVLNETGIISDKEVSAILPIDTSKDIEEPLIFKTPISDDLSANRKNFEKDLIIKTLEECNSNKTKAASILGISRSTLWKKLKYYNIKSNTTFNK